MVGAQLCGGEKGTSLFFIFVSSLRSADKSLGYFYPGNCVLPSPEPVPVTIHRSLSPETNFVFFSPHPDSYAKSLSLWVLISPRGTLSMVIMLLDNQNRAMLTCLYVLVIVWGNTNVHFFFSCTWHWHLLFRNGAADWSQTLAQLFSAFWSTGWTHEVVIKCVLICV